MFLNLALDGSTSPTLFELSMANGLTASLKPAFEYFLGVFAARGHEWAVHTSHRKEEMFLVLMMAVERHYLGTCGASFAENFYGLRRARPDGSDLSPKAKLLSLLELTLVPYLRQLSLGPSDYRKLSVYVWSLYEVASLGFQTAYLFNHSKFANPLLWLQGVVLARLTAEDMKKLSEKAASEAVTWSSNKLRFVLQQSAMLLRYSVILSAVMFKLVEYYYSPQNRAAREAQDMRRFGPSAVPPPRPLPPQLHAAHLLANPALCPICGESRTDPALSSSGYCFCFKCIHKYVEQHKSCPITGSPCELLEIRRIFST